MLCCLLDHVFIQPRQVQSLYSTRLRSLLDGRSRVHIDIETDDVPAEVARLTNIGARAVDRLERWVVMQAPTGQRFCVVRVQRPGFPKNACRWE